jgi:phage FluMu protein Com
VRPGENQVVFISGGTVSTEIKRGEGKGLKLAQAQVFRLRGLLNMMYKPSEIAEELGVSVETIYRSYLPAGAPSVVDSKKRVWIHGPAFAKWVEDYVDHRRGRPRLVMLDSEGYCVMCNTVVAMINSRKRDVKKGVARLTGKCPKCGKVVNRFMRGLPPKMDDLQ